MQIMYRHILANLDFLVVQDMFLSKTARFADVILPAAPSLEKREHLQIQSAVFNVYMKLLNRLVILNQTGGFYKK